MLRLALRRPLITALAAVLIFAGTMASTTLLKTDFLESFADKTTLLVDQELPVGTRLSATSEAAKQVEADAGRQPRGQGVPDHRSARAAATGPRCSSA